MSVPRPRLVDEIRPAIRAELAAITPLDAREAADRAAALAWVDSGAALCRVAKPATPPVHLVAYIALVDADQILLVDHRNARLWPPPGGHVEPGEHPRVTAARELAEELGLAAPHAIEAPRMITRATTVGRTAGHVDVSLWYVVRVSLTAPLRIDAGEFSAARWFPFADVPLERSEPHLGRFLAKLGAGDDVR